MFLTGAPLARRSVHKRPPPAVECRWARQNRDSRSILLDVRATIATVYRVVYCTDGDDAIMFITACSMDDHDEEKTEQNVIVI